MAVTLTISETLTGSGLADSLSGGGTGLDLGQVINGQYTPVVDQPTNDGVQNIYLSHDAVIDPITDVKFYVQQYGVGTGFSYGGANSAAADITKLLNMGNTSSSSNARLIVQDVTWFERSTALTVKTTPLLMNTAI